MPTEGSQGWALPALLAAAGTPCATVYSCFHSNRVDTAEQQNTGTANCRSWAQAPQWMLLFIYKRAKMGSLNFKYIYSSLHYNSFNSPRIKALSNGNIKSIKKSKIVGISYKRPAAHLKRLHSQPWSRDSSNRWQEWDLLAVAHRKPWQKQPG